MSKSAKLAGLAGGLLTMAVFAALVGVGRIWDALLGFVICIESNAACPWD
jgi:hypothetical protein